MLKKMDFGPDNTFSRIYLQGLRKQNRIEKMKQIMNGIYHREIRTIAINGCTQYKFTNFIYQGQTGRPYEGYSPTVEDFVEGFQGMFPGCRVEYSEEWEETKPGTLKQKKYILIDWS